MTTWKEIWRGTSGRFLPGTVVASIPLLHLIWPLFVAIPTFAASIAFDFVLFSAGYAVVIGLARRRLRRVDVVGLRGLVAGLVGTGVTLEVMRRITSGDETTGDVAYWLLIFLMGGAMTFVVYLPVIAWSGAGGVERRPVVAGEHESSEALGANPSLTIPTHPSASRRGHVFVGVVAGATLGLAAVTTIIDTAASANGGDAAWAGGLVALLFGAPIGIIIAAIVGAVVVSRMDRWRPWRHAPAGTWKGHYKGAVVGGVASALASIFVIAHPTVVVLRVISQFIGMLFPALMKVAWFFVVGSVPFIMLSVYGVVALILDRWIAESRANPA